MEQEQGILLENGKHINPMFNYVFIELIDENPYITRKTESGLILPHSALQMSQETGELEKLEQIILFGVVVAAGPTCVSLKVGDEVFFDKRGSRVLPILNGGYRHINEQNILSFVR